MISAAMGAKNGCGWSTGGTVASHQASAAPMADCTMGSAVSRTRRNRVPALSLDRCASASSASSPRCSGEFSGAPDTSPMVERAGPRRRLEIQAGLPVGEPLGGDGVQVALAEQHVGLAADLDLGLVLGVEEDAVADLDGADVGSHRDDPGPGQPPPHGGGGGDDDAGGRTPLAVLSVLRD